MANSDKLVGVIGGMGPDATIDFMSRVLAATPAGKDQDHIRMLVEVNPKVPNRQLAMRGDGDSPGPEIAAMATRLEAAGADFIVMPCNLAHEWQSEIIAATSIPFVSIVEVSVAAARARCGEDSAIGLMTTPGCFSAGIYQRALKTAGLAVVTQLPGELTDTMTFVERIKSGDRSDEVANGLHELGKKLIARGADVLIAACTEFPLLLNESMFEIAFISTTDALARKTVALALGDELPGNI